MKLMNRCGIVNRKLSFDDEELIKFLYRDKVELDHGWTHVKLADKFGVSVATIGRVISRLDS